MKSAEGGGTREKKRVSKRELRMKLNGLRQSRGLISVSFPKKAGL